MAETETKAPGPPERNLPRLGAALRRALRRGPALAPERLNLAPRKGRRRRRRAGRPCRGPASGRRSGASAAPGAPGSTGPLRGGLEPRAAGPAVLPARHTAKLSPGSPGAASTGGRAGGPAAARSAGASAPPASSPPASLRPPARAGGARGAGRGRRGGGGAHFAPVSSGCAAAAMRARAPKSLAASPARASSLAHTPQGRERAGGWRPRPRARSAATECGPNKEEFFALLSSFTLLVFSPKGEKKPHNLRMCARVEIDVGRKKKKGGGSFALAVREETVRASPLRFPGAGGGLGEGEAESLQVGAARSPRPPPLPSAPFLCLSEKEGRAGPLPSPLPPARPGHF